METTPFVDGSESSTPSPSHVLQGYSAYETREALLKIARDKSKTSSLRGRAVRAAKNLDLVVQELKRAELIAVKWT